MTNMPEPVRRPGLPTWVYLAAGGAVVLVIIGAVLVVSAVNNARTVASTYSTAMVTTPPVSAESAPVEDESAKVRFRDIEISGTNPFQPKRPGAGGETPGDGGSEPTPPSADDENLPSVPGEETPEERPTRPSPPGGGVPGVPPGVPPGDGGRTPTPPGNEIPRPPGSASPISETPPPGDEGSFWAPFKRPDGKSGGVMRRSGSLSAGSLKLTGTIVGADGSATAVIADGDQRRIVRPGQQVTVDGKTMSVTAVGRTSMTLSGEHGTLRLPLIGGAGQ